MTTKSYDAIVIGGGPGGYPAAIRLGQLGQTVLCVEKESWGGVCLNWGCIPSKALIAASGLYERIGNAESMGITTSGLSVDVGKMQEWKNGIVKKLTGGVQALMKANGADLIKGTAVLTGTRTIDVTTEDGSRKSFEATKGIILSTGTEVIEIPGFKPDGKTVITAREAVSLTAAPKTLVVIGGGVIGLELGTVYQKLGTHVVVVEMQDQLLPGTDPDLVRVVQKRLKKGGAEILLEARAEGCEVSGDSAKVTVTHQGKKKHFEADKVLVAVGFKPNSKSIGLEAAGVKTDARGHIVSDDQLRTNVASIYAVGDVSGPPYLAHKASKEGELAAEIIAGHKAARDWRGMPSAIFTDPEIATVGLTEAEAKKQGKTVKVGKFPFAASGRAMAIGHTEGFIKVLIDETDHQLLGMGIVGPDASDLICEGALALEMCAFAEDVALTIHPHPTLGEGVMEAFKHALGEAIHVVNR